ncbi:hypothetical protein [Pandoraea cepalis]|nr:hypothetical protein [Pandoraea cepalis]
MKLVTPAAFFALCTFVSISNVGEIRRFSQVEFDQPNFTDVGYSEQ